MGCKPAKIDSTGMLRVGEEGLTKLCDSNLIYQQEY